jgi:hypothetical protein
VTAICFSASVLCVPFNTVSLVLKTLLSDPRMILAGCLNKNILKSNSTIKKFVSKDVLALGGYQISMKLSRRSAYSKLPRLDQLYQTSNNIQGPSSINTAVSVNRGEQS